MRRGSKKFQYIVVGLLLLSVSWFGYWIGYVAAKPKLTTVDDVRNVGRKLLPYEDEGKVKPLPPMKPALKFRPKVDHDGDGDSIIKEVPRNMHRKHAGHIGDALKPAAVSDRKEAEERRRNEAHRNALLRHEEELLQKAAERRQRPRPGKRPPPGRQNVVAKQPVWPENYYALMHSGTATKVHGDVHKRLKRLNDDGMIDPRAFIFHSQKLAKNVNLRPSIANGVLGTAVHASEVFMQGVYNGRYNESHRAAIPSTVSLNITGSADNANFTRNYTLNVGAGVYEEVSVSKDWTLYHRLFAHRKLANLLVVEIDLIRKQTQKPLTFNVNLNKWKASGDITFLRGHENEHPHEASYKHGEINSPETATSQRVEVHVFYDHIPSTLTPPPGAPRTKWVFLTAIATSKVKAKAAYSEGVSLCRGNDQLYASHVDAWHALWQRGFVYMEGSLEQARAVFSAYYGILSSMPLTDDPQWPFIGLTPSGLPFDGYKGHVFWDQDTWMYPPLLMQHVDLARMILDARVRKMSAAAQNAKKNQNLGLRYPWESAFTGSEVCGDVEATQEQHISGDVSLAFMQYLYAQNDTRAFKAFKQGGRDYGEVLSGIARFWVSRLQKNLTTKKYEILNVQPPDEYHTHVNNSVYTNYIAKLALEAPYIAFRRLNVTVDHFEHFAKNIYIPFDAQKHYHPEFDGYKGDKVKQADVVLLGFPLNKKLSTTIRENDLKFYGKVTDLRGPAMTWSMFSIGWREVGDARNAALYYKKNFHYIQNDLQVWKETIKSVPGGAPNFITGCGGFLQNVIFGYGGIRVRPTRLELHPGLPPGSTGLFLKGIDYLGSAIDLYWNSNKLMVTVQSARQGAPPLKMYVFNSHGDIKYLSLHKHVAVKRGKCVIFNANLPADRIIDV